MQCYVHTCSDEGDSPVVIDRFSSIHRFCRHTSVYIICHMKGN